MSYRVSPCDTKKMSIICRILPTFTQRRGKLTEQRAGKVKSLRHLHSPATLWARSRTGRIPDLRALQAALEMLTFSEGEKKHRR